VCVSAGGGVHAADFGGPQAVRRRRRQPRRLRRPGVPYRALRRIDARLDGGQPKAGSPVTEIDLFYEVAWFAERYRWDENQVGELSWEAIDYYPLIAARFDAYREKKQQEANKK
jgi:hypothetical protein